MFYHDKKLQYKVRVDKPDPQFARALQQAIGGIEGEIRVCLQYLFQAWNSRGPVRYRDMLLDTGTEEIAHIEMLATAVCLNLEGSSSSVIETIVGNDPLMEKIVGGGDPRHFLSGGLGALASDANGVPFNGSWIVSSGNIAADMFSNVTAEATGRTLAARLYELTDDAGMKDMLAFLIARDTMHQQQWLAVLEELGHGNMLGVLPIPNSFPQSKEHQEFSYTFVNTNIDPDEPSVGTNRRWTSGPSYDGRSEFREAKAQPYGDEPMLAPPKPEGYAQTEQIEKAGKKN
ncbi:manganese catalase family protein [Spirosoma utsteinense]|uniref:Mn-containing catalase n=1 Tax=Spirosoma utsteinense TaxID=2585773 RepID=A0ABR6WDP6_9BACT|nr:manganese catalase family protein [Spirosoma utsteinense]MBC3787482.1 Mn-containing catalase [Spirosoma utsteinense]MBC3794419.1 Mn-containing catalase [Spirosoma utsteinense]